MIVTECERFWSKVDMRGPDECWPWIGAHTDRGYGTFRASGHTQYAHRLAYEATVGPIPDGLQIDHVKARGCTRKDCCNSRHMEPVTPRENTRRGDALGARTARSGRCHRGHDMTGENRYVRPDGQGSRCKACAAIRNRRRRERLAEAAR